MICLEVRQNYGVDCKPSLILKPLIELIFLRIAALYNLIIKPINLLSLTKHFIVKLN